MGQTDKQFGSLSKAIAAEDIETMRAMLQEILTDLQNTLEDCGTRGGESRPPQRQNDERRKNDGKRAV